MMLSRLPPKSLVSSAADAGVALTLGIAGTFVLALPRFSLGVNDRDAVLDAMVCCLFVVFLKFFRKALKRVLLDLTYERYNNVWLTDQNFCQDSKKRMDGAERHKSGATYHKQGTGEHRQCWPRHVIARSPCTPVGFLISIISSRRTDCRILNKWSWKHLPRKHGRCCQEVAALTSLLKEIVSGPTPNKALFKELVAPPWGL